MHITILLTLVIPPGEAELPVYVRYDTYLHPEPPGPDSSVLFFGPGIFVLRAWWCVEEHISAVPRCVCLVADRLWQTVLRFRVLGLALFGLTLLGLAFLCQSLGVGFLGRLVPLVP